MKNNKIKDTRYESNDTREIKSLIVITLVVIFVVCGVYFFTDWINGRKSSDDNVSIKYDSCLVGNMFNRPYDEYYVFLYSSLDDNASTYTGLITSYVDSDDSLKIYYVDMNDGFNSSYLGDKSNSKPSSVSEVSIKESALIKIKDGKVVKYYENLDDYKKILSVSE